jgi:heme-degrading monooxygenase HmoA
MVVRTWTAHTTPDRESAYLDKVREVVLPHLRTVSGYLGSHFLRRSADSELEILVLTYWESMEAVRALAGEEPTKAYMPPEIAATLERYDHEAVHYDVMIDDPAPS